MSRKSMIISLIVMEVVTFVGVLALWFLFLKPCDHQWKDAECEVPVTCELCGDTAGNPLGHSWNDASCIIAKTCSDCGAIDGEALGHSWNEANCTMAKTCSTCGTTEGEVLGHSWNEANCTTAKTCSICGETEGETLEHSWKDATYSAPKTCTACGATEGSALKVESNSTSNGNSVRRECPICGGEASRRQTQYCEWHDCVGNCPYPAKYTGSGWGTYCEIHSCRHQGCLSQPMGGTSYCPAHL